MASLKKHSASVFGKVLLQAVSQSTRVGWQEHSNGIGGVSSLPSASAAISRQTKDCPGLQSAGCAGRLESHWQPVPGATPKENSQSHCREGHDHCEGGHGSGLTKPAPPLPADAEPALFRLPPVLTLPAKPSVPPTEITLPVPAVPGEPPLLAPPGLVERLPAAPPPASIRATPPQPSASPLPIRTMLWNILLLSEECARFELMIPAQCQAPTSPA